jgi:membrane fusion protein (multidrug efflux system)
MQIHTRCALVLITAAAAAVAALGCGGVAPSESVCAPEAASDREAPVVDVTTVRVQRGSIRQRVSASGSLLARRESRIGAEVRGRIQAIFVREGDRVEAGARLFQIDPEAFEVALRQAEAGLDLARSERRQIEADLERLQALRRKQIVSAENLGRVETQVAVARARERQASESVAMARYNLGQTLVVAPYAGSIAARLVDEGTTALVQPQTLVVVIQETAELEAEVHIPESQLPVVRVGDPAQIYVQGLAQPIEAEVAAAGDTIDPATRTYHVRLIVENADHRLKAGSFARIELLPHAKTGVVLVPREAVRTEGGHTRVLVVRDGRAESVPVQLGIISQSEAEVLSGIRVDSEVIVGEAAREIAPGMQVRVVARAPGSAS